MSSRIVAEGVAAPLLPTSAPPPDRRLPKTRLRRRSLLPSSVDLPCFLIVIGLILCSISVGSLVTVLGRGASPLRRPSIGGWDYARLPAAIPTTGFETFLPDQVVDGDDDKKGAESESANVGDARLAKALAITEATGGRYLVRDWPLSVLSSAHCRGRNLSVMTDLVLHLFVLQLARLEQHPLHLRSLGSPSADAQPNARHTFTRRRPGVRALVRSLRRLGADDQPRKGRW